MTEDQKKRCQKIIHAHAATAAAGNAVPVPGLGVALERKFKEKKTQLQQLPSKS